MADIYCPTCGEPWDADELHYVEGKSYVEARTQFQKEGCAVFGASHTEPSNKAIAMAASAVMDLSEYPDDWAADMADFDW